MVNRRSLLGCIAALLAYHQVAAQTIVVDGEEIPASTETVEEAAQAVSGDYLPEESVQLTDAILANLTDLELSNVSVLYFEDTETVEKRSLGSQPQCKTFPGDLLWPNSIVWKVLDLVTGGAIIKTTPIGAPCYDDSGAYDLARCYTVLDQWSNSSLHSGDPTSVMYPLYQGLTCVPGEDPAGDCTLGAYPSYVVDARNVAHIQLAVNFARTLNLRLVIKNTGHDMLGRSVGAGALSVWTHRFKGIQYFKSYRTSSYTGPAIKVGAGVVGQEVFAAAEKYGVTVVGGEGLSVGFAGGYLAGGGHSPLSSKYGIAADSILSIEVVTADGRFITANESQNQDLFWALRGGGGSTYGVVTSYTVKAYPQIKAAFMKFSFSTSETISSETFWSAVRAYLEAIPTFKDAGTYEYWDIFAGSDSLAFTMHPWFAPGLTLQEFTDLTKPLFDYWKTLGIEPAVTASEHSSFFSAWQAGFPREAVGGYGLKIAGRMFPRQNFEDSAKFEATFNALKSVPDKGGMFVGLSLTGGPGPYPDNAVNPAWRNNVLFAVAIMNWPEGTPWEVTAEKSQTLTNDWMQPWRDVTPGSGSYASETDVTEPNFKQSLYGTENYARLLSIKDQVDPTGLFYARQAVGSDRWYITGQDGIIPTQNGRLCRV